MTVLQSFPIPRPTTNPYLIMLGEALRRTPGVTVLNFSWKTALFGRYDVYHSHWPEILVGGRTPLRRLTRQALALMILIRLRLTRRPIVRTVHNVERPDGLTARESALLDVIDRQTTMRIRLNSTTRLPDGERFKTIPHGHYRDWFARYEPQEMQDGQIGYVGLIRRYKGVEGLVSAFRETEGRREGLTLRLGGNPSTSQLAASVASLADGDRRIELHLAYLSDAELVEIVTSSELVVLPYRFMHNSGGALAALSLNRPVLVPDNEVNRKLSDEVGSGWVHLFDGELTAESIITALDAAAVRADRPDLSARDWDRAGIEHADVYRAAIDAGHRR
ncbi:glycosyl transferase [Glaciihabitans sp. UYNi722]|uniref:glycosyl transferase n=1 Tax=Glaciihabitans sp. UYNi722 TaxID=3156344 RepID=UPI0033916688